MNLYELELVDRPEPPHDRDGFLASDVAEIMVYKSMLTGNQNRLIDYAPSKAGRMIKVGERFPEPTIRALAVLLDLASQPYMCSSNYAEALVTTSKRKKQKKGGEDDESIVVTEVNKSWTYDARPAHGGESRIMNRMAVYLQTVMDRDQVGVLGWIFTFLIHDTSLSFDDGIGVHADLNYARLQRRGGTNAFWQWELDTTSWIRLAVSPYSGMRFSTENNDDPIQQEQARLAFSLPLRDRNNPARVDRNFTFEAAREHWDETFCMAQRRADSYFDENHFFVRFPLGARWIPPQMLDARAILFGLLERPAYAVGTQIDRLESLMSLTMAADHKQDESPDHMLKVVTKSFGDLIRTPADRTKPECSARFFSWVGSDSAPPGIQACWDFVRAFHGHPVVPEKTAVVDPTLSPFGNAVAWEMLVFEQLFDAAYLHTELLFDVINSVGAFRCKRTLRLHTLCLGPPASGKSWKQEMLVKLCTPNTTKMVGHQTKRSDTTNTNRDCTIRIMDEANEAMSDKGGDGAGRAELKQILTSGVTFTEQCIVDNERKTRETMEVVSYLLILLNANSNAEITAFPQSMISRLMVRYIPERKRADMIDPSLRDSVMGHNPLAEKEIERHQLRHALAGLVSHAIDVGWLPEVDMDYAIILLDDILDRLKKVGVNPDARSKQRLPLYMRALTIWYAVYMVFQTNAHFEPGTPFKPEHILECARYLRCSRELVYFAVTHMYDTLINVNAPVVCKAIKKLIEMQEGEKGMHPKRAKTDKRSGEYDTDWYFLHLPLMGIKDEELLHAGVKQITSAIERDDSVVYSPEMVMDTLRWMMTQRVKGSNKAAMRVSRSRFDEVGLLFDVNLIDGDAINHVMNAVKESMDDWVRETPARFVTGITYREGVTAADGLGFESNRMFPHLFRVIDAESLPKTGKPFMMRNPLFRERGYNTLFAHTPELDEGDAEEPYVVLKLDLDKRAHEDRLVELGLSVADKTCDAAHVMRLEGKYPHTLAKTHVDRFGKGRFKVVTASSAMTTEAPAVTRAEEGEDEEENYLFGM